MSTLRVALVQMNSSVGVEENLATIVAAVHRAAESGAGLVCFPENATTLAPEARRVEEAESLDSGLLEPVLDCARECGVYVHLGSVVEASDEGHRTYNTSVLICPQNGVVATYRKMHLFDVRVSGDTTFEESATVKPGPAAVETFVLGDFTLGFSICYDLRFPELYRALVDKGADVLLVPAAFTYRTGAAHWETLLRARAIENGAYVLAAGQVGRHYGNRESWGHSMVVAPWGHVVSNAGFDADIIYAELDTEHISSAREKIPSLAHRRYTVHPRS